jgi:hypothetical protein
LQHYSLFFEFSPTQNSKLQTQNFQKNMRILGSLDQNGLKITVFKNDNRISLKLENEQYEQTFKFREDERLEGLESVKKVVDSAFLAKIQANFQAMHAMRLEAFERAFPISEEIIFDEII